MIGIEKTKKLGNMTADSEVIWSAAVRPCGHARHCWTQIKPAVNQQMLSCRGRFLQRQRSRLRETRFIVPPWLKDKLVCNETKTVKKCEPGEQPGGLTLGFI